MMMTTAFSGAAAALREGARRIDYLPLLEEIRVPTLVIVGREDACTPLALAEQLRDKIPGSKLVVIDGSHAESGAPASIQRGTGVVVGIPTPAC
jgi:3-oxoadipate enol-lactonase